MDEKLTATIAIPTYNREKVLVDTLRSVRALDPGPEEVIVVDQTLNHEKETEAFLEKAASEGWIRWIRQQPPRVTTARNRLIAEARTDVLVFIDDDVDLPRDFLAQHLKNYRDPKVVAVAGRVRQEKESPYPKTRDGKWPKVLDYKYLSVFSTQRVEGVTNFMGCNHSVRLETLKKIGGYDINYRGQSLFEETDLSIRIWKAGGTIVFDPQAHLFHFFAPVGGCRIPATKKGYPEWWVPFNRHYFAFRHLRYIWEFWRCLLFKDFRETVLRKANLRMPWVIPWSFLSYYYSMVQAARLAFRKEKEEKSADR
jgi:GT2 family glycosyltransferase